MHVEDAVLPRELDEEACWAAILQRDEGTVGRFFFGVVTTGIFCRPSCPARRPKRENLRLFASAAEAKRAGFRACKRCAPEAIAPAQRQADVIARLCRQIRDSEDMPSLNDLASESGFSVFHLHRLFKRVTGLTPKAYGAAVKAERMRAGLSGSASVTKAIYDAGYASSSRFYENADDILGMKPRDYKAGGQGIEMVYAIGRCWLGLVLVAATQRGICAILFGDEEGDLRSELGERFPAATIEPGGVDFGDRLAEVLAAIEQPRLAGGLPLDILGTAFQQRIWTALRQVPLGETASYAQIADRIGAPKAARGVARACAANPIAIAIPCHRIVRADGNLAGYRWGLERKRMLLAREAYLSESVKTAPQSAGKKPVVRRSKTV